MAHSSEIRKQFIDFFVRKHGHTAVPSSPVVPHGDATLLFTNAGMNQFKDVFLGTGSRDYRRAVDTQKCIRAGGKHNDLEDVGRDTYHHTFFEMLGNWSFGDYFKKEAIAWAWELLTKEWGIDKTRLHATVFGGDPAEGLEPDHEAAELWKTVTDIDHSHIHFGNKKDNFWEMGESGPCGPCSEIHIDRTPDKSGGKLVNAGDARVMEIWNLVFIQFNRAPGSNGQLGKLHPLPAKHVDTGMGFERVCSVLQGKSSNYDTDVFTPIFDAIRKVTHAPAYTGVLENRVDIAYRVLADHIRCLTFAITDGAAPSNEGRGYVLRRILRRAVRHGRQTLGMNGPFLYQLVPALVASMGEAFPELKQNPQHVMDVIKDEEESFGRTIDRGIELFEQASITAIERRIPNKTSAVGPMLVGVDERLGQGAREIVWFADANGQRVKVIIEQGADKQRKLISDLGLQQVVISGQDAFKLHDTYGFPLDLTQVMAEERGMTVDVDGFNKLMEEAREISRGTGGEVDIAASLNALSQQEKFKPTTFHGYEGTELEPLSTIRVYELHGAEFKLADKAQVGARVAVVLDETVFYAQAGGQVGDVGVIQSRSGSTLRVTDTQKVGDVYFHLGTVEDAPFSASPGMPKPLKLDVDRQRRSAIMANHTSTHLLNRALRDLVNDQTQQKGSLVDEQKLRFDFAHGAALTLEQLEAVEKQVNADIASDLPVYTDVAEQGQALKIKGLRAVFGEKYPPKVRVVAIGAPVKDLLSDPASDRWAKLSIEFCGGTHLAKTGDAEGLVIVSEEAVAKGVRRITAQTGPVAHQTQARADMLLARVQAIRGLPGEKIESALAELTEAIGKESLPAIARAKLRDGIAELQKLLKEQKKQESKVSAGAAVDAARQMAEAAEGDLIVAELPGGADATALRSAMDVIRKKLPGAALLLAGVSGEGPDAKVALIAAVPADKIAVGLKAGDWVKQAAQAAGGSGGGKPDMAQAGAKDPSKLPAALEAARAYAQRILAASKA